MAKSEPMGIADGEDVATGSTSDAQWGGSGPASVISILKKLALAGGTGGGPATIADGADVAQGSTSDTAWTSGNGTVISLLKKIASAGGSAVSVADGADVAQGTTTDASSANTVIGLLKAIKAAVQGTLGISGTVTANAGTNLNTSALALDATLTGGTQKAKLVDTGGTNVASVSAGGALKVDGSAATQPVSLAAAVKVNVEPETSGGHSISRVLAAASTNATSVKASAGQVYGWYIYNASAAVKYVKLYNKASSPTVGSDTPVMTIGIPAGAAANVEFTNGISFGTGIALAITGAQADADTTAVAAGDVALNLLYK